MISPKPFGTIYGWNGDTTSPWFICKWYEPLDIIGRPGKLLFVNHLLSADETSELTYLGIDDLHVAPFGDFAQFIHPSGYIVQLTKIPHYLRAVRPDEKPRSFKDRFLNLMGF